MTIDTLPTLRYTREQLLAVIDERLPWAENYDALRLKEHQKAEKAYLAEFRARCRAAAKWDYAEAARNFFSISSPRLDRPQCPKSVAIRLRNYRAFVERHTEKKRFVISPRGETATIHYLLTFDPDAQNVEMC